MFLGVFAFSAVGLHADLYMFEDGLDSLQLTEYVSGSTYTPLASGGLNDSAALSSAFNWGQVSTQTGQTASFADLGVGESHTSSIYVKKSGGAFEFDPGGGGYAGFHSTSLIGLGIMDAPDTHLAVDPSFSPWQALSAHVIIDANNQYYLSVYYGEDVDVVDGDTAISLLDGWYFFEVTYTRSAINQISMDVSLSSADNTGAVGASLLSLSTGGFVTQLATSSEVYSGFISSTRAGGELVDNFLAIPEPSTYAAIAGLLFLGMAIYRRRSRK